MTDKSSAVRKASGSTVPMATVAAELATQTGMTKKSAAKALGEFAVLVAKHLKKGNKVRINGLGTFQINKKNKGKIAFKVAPSVPGAIGDKAAAGPGRKIVDRVVGLIGDRDEANAWFDYQPLPAFENKTPRQLVAEGRATAVQLHLDTLEDGVYA